MREENGVGAEGVDVVESRNNAVKGIVVAGVEVDGIDLVEDGVLPPEIGAHAGAYPAGSCKRLRCCDWSRSGEDDGEAEEEKPAGSFMGNDHAVVIEMLPETVVEWDDWKLMLMEVALFLAFGIRRFYGQ